MNPARFSSSTFASASDWQRRKAEGRAYLNANCLTEAQEVFTHILQEHPDDLETYLWLGNCYLAQRDPVTAYQLYARAQALDPDHPAIERLLRLARTNRTKSVHLHLRQTPGHDGPGTPEALASELVVPAATAKRLDGKEYGPSLAASMHAPGPRQQIAIPPSPAQAHYLLGLEVFFNARHFVTVDGKAGPIHSHSFRVTVRIRHAAIRPGQEYVLGFGIVRELVQSETNQLNDTLLNNLAPYRDDPLLQPTTESLAATIFQHLRQKLPAKLRLESVTVWESPTNSVTYQEDPP